MPLGLSAGAIAGIGAGVSGIGSLVSGIFGSSASSAAAKAQLTASQEALQSQNAEEAHQNLLQAPYIENGDNRHDDQRPLTGTRCSTITSAAAVANTSPLSPPRRVRPRSQVKPDGRWN